MFKVHRYSIFNSEHLKITRIINIYHKELTDIVCNVFSLLGAAT